MRKAKDYQKNGSSKKKGFVVIDAETDPFKHGRIPRPFLWCVYDGYEHLFFDTAREMLDHLKELNVIAYAHNGGRFDFHFLVEFADEWEAEVLLIHGRISKFTVGKCEFRDSWNVLPISLAGYQKTEIDYAIFEEGVRDQPSNRRAIMNYLADDCTYLYEMLEGFFKQYSRQLTLASTAVKTWEKMSDSLMPKTKLKYYDVFAPFYYGGRVECFQSGVIEKPSYVVDINSAYPWAMMQKHPYGSVFLEGKGRPAKIFGHCFYRFVGISKGALPVKDEKTLELYFPNDDQPREYSVTGWEVLAGLETETLVITKWINYYRHYDMADFKPYILHFYEGRKEAKRLMKENADDPEKYREYKAQDIYYKLLMNSLYGKFGASPMNYTKNEIFEANMSAELIANKSGEGWRYGGVFGDKVMGARDLLEDEMRFFNVATSASITGYVRAYLWRSIQQVKGIIYCDTDSMICEELGKDLPLGKELGNWKEEGRFLRAGISGKKLYILEPDPEWFAAHGEPCKTKHASKGGKLTDEQLWSLARGEETVFSSEAPSFSVRFGSRFIDRKFRPTTFLKNSLDSEIEED